MKQPRTGRRVGIVDVTLRDGHQSLWATRMRNATILGFADKMDALGFKYVDLVGGAVFDVCVRYLREDPWERMRLVADQVRDTPLQVHTRGQSLWTFELFPDDVVALAIKRARANGMRHIFTYDCLNDVRNLDVTIQVARAEGMTVTAGLVYTLSPVHTDDYFGACARELIRLGANAICIKDPTGLLTPDRVRTLVPTLRLAIGDAELEMHSHAQSGLAPLCLLEGVELGVDVVHTAISPLSHGASHSPTEWVVMQLERCGYSTGTDRAGLASMAEYFQWVAQRDGMPLGGIPAEYDPALYEHQIPGGQISNLLNQLRELGMVHRLKEVMEEMAQVRVALGYPPVVSPMAQYIATQAVLNVLHDEPYRSIPVEIRNYVRGYYGRPPGPIDPYLADRVAGAASFSGRAGDRLDPILDRVRSERGPFATDDDLLLAVFYSDDVLDALFSARRQAAGRFEEPCGRTPIADLLTEFGRVRELTHLELESDDFRMRVSR